MKRLLLLFLAAASLGLGTPYARPAEGQRIGFLFNMGFMTRDGLAIQWLTLGPEFVLPVAARWSINPEVAVWGSNFGFQNYYLVPGVLVSFRIGRITVGGGAVRRFWFSQYPGGDTSESIAPKIQVGYGSRNSRIALAVIPFSSKGYVSVGVSFAFGF
jgi:hypothetical protein